MMIKRFNLNIMQGDMRPPPPLTPPLRTGVAGGARHPLFHILLISTLSEK